MMKPGHWSASSTPAALGAWGLVTLEHYRPWVIPGGLGTVTVVAVLCAGLMVWCSTWNDLDHPRFKDKMHPVAALIRGSGRVFYRIRTERDKHRSDVHRGPSHCIEWCVLVGVVVTVATAFVPPLAPWAVLWGASVFLGTFSHVLADLMTPSGVPLCATYNYLVYREVWKRHTLNWFSTDSGAEHYGAVPALCALTTLVLLAMSGLLGPLAGWLIGVMS